MPVETDADRSVFSNPDEFGVVFNYASATATEEDLTGVLIEVARSRFSDTGVIAYPVMLGAVAAAGLPDDAAPGAKTPDVVTLADARRFAPRTIERDGTGMCRIGLELID